MLSFEEVGEMLDDIADELPEDFFKELNGGVSLLPDVRLHPDSGQPGGLYTMGEYRVERGMGRYINIYYGSFAAVHPRSSPEQLKRELRKTLLHEFTHHLESLAGERGLEIEDKIKLERYKSQHHMGPDKYKADKKIRNEE